MKPLVLWARDRNLTIRYTGRKPGWVQGLLVDSEETYPFEFETEPRRLTIDWPEGRAVLYLDEYGLVVKEE